MRMTFYKWSARFAIHMNRMQDLSQKYDYIINFEISCAEVLG